MHVRIARLVTLAAAFCLVLHAAQSAEKRDETSTSAALPAAATRPVDFARDIAPIFATHCNSCHGADAHEGRLRLDAKKIVMSGGVSGPALVPGHSAASLLVRRIAGLGDEERMPLDTEPLTDEQIGLVRGWIDQGAAWPDGVGANVVAIEKHWAYVKPVRPELPTVRNPVWVGNAIDAFVLSRLETGGLEPSPAAEKARLLRRVSLDLIGLPPSVEEIDAFLHDSRPDAYEQLVRRLLASPRYGERWARHWLDLARYADSNGYQADQYREVWPYRDWVIRAMNDDMPFDRFTIEQIAGDLLPDATLDQKIATGFHRQTTCNVEAGVDPEENRVNQVIDRVNTTGTVWLGTTIECGQCHNHKYDPFTQRDYYGLFAFFNNTLIEVKHTTATTYDFYGPTLPLPFTAEQLAERSRLKALLMTAEERLKPMLEEVSPQQERWIGEQELLVASNAVVPGAERKSAGAAGSQDCGATPDAPGASPAEAGGKATLPQGIFDILTLPAEKRNQKQRDELRAYYLSQQHPQAKKVVDSAEELRKRLASIKPPSTLVMVEQDQPRATHLLKRGNFLTPGAAVPPGVPRILHPLPAGSVPNRLGLAEWLVDRDNPLVARVAVNRWWAEIFGQGIVRTAEDFGTQGEPPTHPQLLDWLAVEFMESGWSMKHVHWLIVTSNTYRQSSSVTPILLKRDPDNRLLARGPRFRMPAELVRDTALAVCGELSGKMGGPPVFPPQPAGIWRHVGRNAPKYETNTDEDRFRRGIYVIWRRSAPYPSFMNFDAPERAACVIQRPRTNTPLQALTLLNDEAFVEMAWALAEKAAAGEPSATVSDRVVYAFRTCVSRSPTPKEAELLEGVYRQELERFRGNPSAAQALLGKIAPPQGVSREELAAWFYVANILLNLDETITKG